MAEHQDVTSTDHQSTTNSNGASIDGQNDGLSKNSRQSVCKSAQPTSNRSPLPIRQQTLSLSARPHGRGTSPLRSRSVSPLALFRNDHPSASDDVVATSSNQMSALSDYNEPRDQLRKSPSIKSLQFDLSSSSQSLHPQSASKLPTYFPPLTQNTQPTSDHNMSSKDKNLTTPLPPLSRTDSVSSSISDMDSTHLKRSVSFSRVSSVRSISTLDVPSMDYIIDEDDDVFRKSPVVGRRRHSIASSSGSKIDFRSTKSDHKIDDGLTKSDKKKMVRQRYVLLSESSLKSERKQSFQDVVEAVRKQSGRGSLERQRSKDKKGKLSTSGVKQLSDNGGTDTPQKSTDELVKEVQKRFTRNLSRRISRASLVSLTSSMGGRSMSRHKITKDELKEKWLSAIKVVRSIVRLSLWLKDYSRSRAEPQTIEQLNYYSMRTEFASEKLVFDKGYYAASNVIYTPPWARRMMTLDPEDRSSNDIQHLASILRSMKFFKNEVPPEKVYDLCKHCRYSRYEKQRLLVRNGHRSMFTYLILSGSVFVNIEEKNIDSGRKYYRTALILGQGTIFGEIAVIHDVPRTASIVVREDVELLVIDKETCLRIFPDIMKRDYELRLEKMRATDLFHDWPEESLHALCVVSKKLEYPYGAVIEKNTRESEFIYVVTKGRVEVMCYISLTSFTAPATHEDKVIKRLIRNPPNHTYLPPMPAPAPPLLCRKSLDKATSDGKVLVSVDSLTPFDICDLVSLNKHSEPMALILVSRGSEVIRIPKLRLHTIPPIRFWKAIVQRAKDTPRYPPSAILSRIFFEHSQWKSYRGIVLRDVLSYTTDCHPIGQDKLKGRKQGEHILPAIKLQVKRDHDDEWDVRSIESDDVFTAPSYKKCLSLYAPLHDIKRHAHSGPCLRSWKKPQIQPRRIVSPRYKKRAMSLTSYS